MTTIEIEWLTATSEDCDTCGTMQADGARVFVDGVLALDLAPVAHCHSGLHYDQTDVYDRILRHFGHSVEHV